MLSWNVAVLSPHFHYEFYTDHKEKFGNNSISYVALCQRNRFKICCIIDTSTLREFGA